MKNKGRKGLNYYAFGGEEDDLPPIKKPSTDSANPLTARINRLPVVLKKPKNAPDYSDDDESYEQIDRMQHSSGDTYDLMYKMNLDARDKSRKSYDKINAPIVDDKSGYVNFTQGKLKGAKVPHSIVSSIIDAAEKQGVDPYTMLALAGQESTFGTGYTKDTNIGYTPTQLVSNWGSEKDNSPYPLDRFLADKKVKGVNTDKGSMGQWYEVSDEDEVRKYVNKNPDLMVEYGKKLAKYKDPTMNALEDAALRIKTKGIKGYNPGDKTYEATINDVIGLLKKDPSLSEYMNTRKRMKKAFGGDIAAQMPQLLDSLLSLTENRDYSQEPIVNASTARSMVSPYAYGGTIEDLDPNEQMELEQAAFAQGLTPEELFDQINQDNDNSGTNESNTEGLLGNNNEDTGTYSSGGKIGEMSQEIRRGRNKGKNRAYKAYGGNTMNKINVEGNEVVDMPGRQPFKVHGPKHERGGVDMNVPDGTTIFSDRIKIGGDTMQERKIKREKRIAKLDKLLESNPTSKLARNTVERSNQILEEEEQQDVALMNMANKIYAQPREKMAFGGRTKGYAAGGGPIDTTAPLGAWWMNEDPINAPSEYQPYQLPNNSPLDRGTGANLNYASDGMGELDPMTFGGFDKAASVETPSKNASGLYSGFTTGDYVGVAGTVLGSTLPLLNTAAQGRNTHPTINRYKGFGHDAIAANDEAQTFAARSMNDELGDVETEFNTEVAGINSNASDIGVARALRAGAGISRNMAGRKARGNYATTMTGLLGRRGELTNMRDRFEDYGQTNADTENEAKLDNLFTARGQDYQNMATSIQSLGRNLNISKGNQVDAQLIAQLSKYGLGIDENGQLISIPQ